MFLSLILNKVFLSISLFVSESVKENLSIYLLKFNSLNISKTLSLSHSSTLKFSKVSAIGTSKLIVPNVFDINANSLLSTIFSLCFPFSPSSFFSIASYNFSIEPNFFINVNAVFSPTPGTPGILSELSPCNPFTSISCLGSIPYFSIIFSLLNSSVSVFPAFV